MAGESAHDDDIAGAQLPFEDLLDVVAKGITVDAAVGHEECDEACWGQSAKIRPRPAAE